MTRDPSTAADAWLERALAADADEHRAARIADTGFTARVMATLPAAAPPWRRPALIALWTIALAGLALALPGVALDLGREAYRLVAAQPVSLGRIASGLIVLGVVTWSLAGYAWLRSDSGAGGESALPNY